MKVEIGKRYVRRDGTVTKPLEPDPIGWAHSAYDAERELVHNMDHDWGSQVFPYVDREMPHDADLMREAREDE